MPAVKCPLEADKIVFPWLGFERELNRGVLALFNGNKQRAIEHLAAAGLIKSTDLYSQGKIGGGDAEVARRLRFKQLLSQVSAEETNDLLLSIGPDHFNALRRHDALLESMATLFE